MSHVFLFHSTDFSKSDSILRSLQNTMLDEIEARNKMKSEDRAKHRVLEKNKCIFSYRLPSNRIRFEQNLL